MLGRIYAVMLNTFREASRNRVLYGIVAVVLGVNFFGLVLGELALQERARVVRDVGLAAISIVGSVTAIVLGVLLLYTEVQRRTIHTIISKPVERYEFVLGKYLGMALTLTFLVGLFGVTLSAILLLQGQAPNVALLKAIILTYMEVLIVAGIAVFFSSFSSPFLSGVFSLLLFVLGRLTGQMYLALEAKQEWIRHVVKAALYVVPDLHLFSVSGGEIKGQYVSVHEQFVSWGYVFASGVYAFLYLGMLLLIAIAIFQRRDFV